MKVGLSLCLAMTLGAACGREKTGVVEGPPLTIAPSAVPTPSAPPRPSAPPAVAGSVAPGAPDPDGGFTMMTGPGALGTNPSSELGPPVIASFVDLSSKGEPVRFRACEQVVVAVVKGSASVLGETLATGDLLLAQGRGGFDLKGSGEVLLAYVRPKVCDPQPPGSLVDATKQVIRGKSTPTLTWADGKMSARLDAQGDVSPLAYVGRLRGTAAVAEHRHEGSWEILCAVEGAGTVKLDGKIFRLEPRRVLMVPPGAPHAFAPDPGTELVAVQMYVPPGPEQRFKALAGAASDGGPAKGPAPR